MNLKNQKYNLIYKLYKLHVERRTNQHTHTYISFSLWQGWNVSISDMRGVDNGRCDHGRRAVQCIIVGIVPGVFVIFTCTSFPHNYAGLFSEHICQSSATKKRQMANRNCNETTLWDRSKKLNGWRIRGISKNWWLNWSLCLLHTYILSMF